MNLWGPEARNKESERGENRSLLVRSFRKVVQQMTIWIKVGPLLIGHPNPHGALCPSKKRHLFPDLFSHLISRSLIRAHTNAAADAAHFRSLFLNTQTKGKLTPLLGVHFPTSSTWQH